MKSPHGSHSGTCWTISIGLSLAPRLQSLPRSCNLQEPVFGLFPRPQTFNISLLPTFIEPFNSSTNT